MRRDIVPDLVERLTRDFGFVEEKGWLRRGTCPSCKKKELYTHADHPFVLKCGRLNNCAYEENTKAIYPDAFENFNKRYEATPQKPNATAEAYLRFARGIDPTAITGWFEQGKFWHPRGNKGTATVRFYVDPGRTIYMERFVEEVIVTEEDGEKKARKANFKGEHKGLWWAPPGLQINDGDEVWIVEGILNAICLNLSGIKAVAVLSCVNYPATMLGSYKGKDVTWVWALDNDKAGRDWTKEHVDRMRKEGFKCAAAQPPYHARKKSDWNDLYQLKRITPKDIEEYRYQGALLISESPSEKALLIYNRTERKEFPFEFRNRLFWFALNLDRFTKAEAALKDGLNETQKANLTKEQIREQALKESGAIAEIANCYFRFLYFQANVVTDESWYYCRISFPHSQRDVKNTFTGGQVSSASEFKKRLLGIAAGAVFTGSGQQLDRIIKDQLYDIKTVATVDFIGYAKEHGAWVFNDIAIKEGRVFTVNDEDFFDCGKLAIKSLAQSVPLAIQRDGEKYNTEWVNHIYTCFGAKGIVALAFWFGSLFAEQIREMHKSFPFLEVVGEPGAGKSTLIEFLWKLVGRRDYEGVDPSKATLAARARNFAQVANLPVVLIEGDRDEDTAKHKKFDWDELKTAYNGRSVRARGLKNSGNETYEPPFRGTIVISQNAEVAASEAVLQRIVHLGFTKDEHTPATKAIVEQLERAPVESVSHFLLAAITREREVLEILKANTPGHEQTLLGLEGVKSVRIAKNHAQMMALVDALAKVIPISPTIHNHVHDTIAEMAEARQLVIADDLPIVTEFWSAFDYLNQKQLLDHSKNEELIAVNLNHFVEVATTYKQQVPPIADLKRALKSSKVRKFVDIKGVNSAVNAGHQHLPETVKCWVFENSEGRV